MSLVGEKGGNFNLKCSHTHKKKGISSHIKRKNFRASVMYTSICEVFEADLCSWTAEALCVCVGDEGEAWRYSAELLIVSFSLVCSHLQRCPDSDKNVKTPGASISPFSPSKRRNHLSASVFFQSSYTHCYIIADLELPLSGLSSMLAQC